MNSHFELISGISDDNNHIFLSKYNSFFISRVYAYSHFNKENIYTVLKKSHDKEEVEGTEKVAPLSGGQAVARRA